MEYVEFTNINKELLDFIKPGDLIKVNDLKKHLRVIAVSENYFVMARKILGKWEYLICEKKPWKDIRKNLMLYGKFNIGSDGWVFGSPVWKDFGCKDYDFDNLEASQAYINSFELPGEDRNHSFISTKSAVPICKIYIKSIEGTEKEIVCVDSRDYWHHINLRKKELDLPNLGREVLFAQYNSDLKAFFKFVGCINKDGYIEYQSGTWKKISDTKSKFYWRELPEDPVVE